MDALFALAKELATPKTWSAGVELARNSEFQEEMSGNADERVFVLFASGKGKPSRISLSEESEIWQCDCSSEEDPCAHVVAAIIAVRQDKIAKGTERRSRTAEGTLEGDSNEARPSAIQSRVRIVNVFTPVGDSLVFSREIRFGMERLPVSATLARAITDAQKRYPSLRYVGATEDELRLDHVLGSSKDGRLSPKTMRLLIPALARIQNVFLEEEEIVVGDGAILPEAVVDDTTEGGFTISRASHQNLEKLFANGAALLRGTPMADGSPGKRVLVVSQDSGLSNEEWIALEHGTLRFRADELLDLATRVIPTLQARIKVTIRSHRIPRARSVKPRLLFETVRSPKGESVTVVPKLIYGDPQIAEVRKGQLVPISPRDVPIRDVVGESALIRELHTSFGLKLGEGKVFPGESAAHFLARAKRYCATGDGVATFNSASELTPQIEAVSTNSTGGDTLATPPPFRLTLGTQDGSESVSFEAAYKVFREGGTFVQCDSGQWNTIPREWMATHGAEVARLLAARDQEGKLPASKVGEVVGLCETSGITPPLYYAKLREALVSTVDLPEVALPNDFTATLRSYQRHGVNWLGLLRSVGMGALLADDMGLGKTVQAIAHLTRRSLVIVPTSVLYSWQKQLAQFRPNLSINRYHGPNRSFDCEADVVLTTYTLVRMELELFKGEEWDTIVVDEAQTIRNPESQISTAVRELRGVFKVCLSGTPVENSLKDLWSQSEFINPGLLGSYREFSERFGELGGAPLATSGASPMGSPVPSAAIAVVKLRTTVQPFILRRLKRDVAKDLPPKTEVVLECELRAEEQKSYESLLLAARSEVVQRLAEGASPLSALELLLRLRQACCHRGLLPGIHADSSSKTDLLIDSLHRSKEQGHRALVFSQWTSFLDLIEPHLKEKSLSFLRIDGGTTNRDAIVEQFQSKDGPDVLLLSLKAGGVGLTLTAADHVYIVDPWWNPAVEDQASDRAHRIGQVNPVMVYRLVAQNTVEERVLELQNRKRALLSAAVGDSGQVALSKDEILSLLSD